MTTAAWVMLAVTWSVVLFFCGRFFLMVLREDPDQDRRRGGE